MKSIKELTIRNNNNKHLYKVIQSVEQYFAFPCL